jgi:hypothetical protein
MLISAIFALAPVVVSIVVPWAIFLDPASSEQNWPSG